LVAEDHAGKAVATLPVAMFQMLSIVADRIIQTVD
jgi:hypothetical protein